MDIFDVVVGVAIYLAGIVTSAFSEIIHDLLSEPYHHWKDKKEIKKENVETVMSLISDLWFNLKKRKGFTGKRCRSVNKKCV